MKIFFKAICLFAIMSLASVALAQAPMTLGSLEPMVYVVNNSSTPGDSTITRLSRDLTGSTPTLTQRASSIELNSGMTHHMLILPNGRDMLVSNKKTGEVNVYSLLGSKFINKTTHIPNPTKMVATANGKYVYVMSQGNDSIFYFSTAGVNTKESIDALALPLTKGVDATSIAIATLHVVVLLWKHGYSHLQQYLFVTDKSDGSVRMIPLNKEGFPVLDVEQWKKFNVGADPTGITIGPNNQYGYVTFGGSNANKVVMFDVDLARRYPLSAKLATVTLNNPVSSEGGIAFSQDGERAYITTTRNVAVYNTEDVSTTQPATLVTTIPVLWYAHSHPSRLSGPRPSSNKLFGITAAPGGRYIDVSSQLFGMNFISVIDTQKVTQGMFNPRTAIVNTVPIGNNSVTPGDIVVAPPTVHLQCPQPKIWTRKDTRGDQLIFGPAAASSYVDDTYMWGPGSVWPFLKEAWYVRAGVQDNHLVCIFTTDAWIKGGGTTWAESTVSPSFSEAFKNLNPRGGIAGAYNINRNLNADNSYLWWWEYTNPISQVVVQKDFPRKTTKSVTAVYEVNNTTKTQNITSVKLA